MILLWIRGQLLMTLLWAMIIPHLVGINQILLHYVRSNYYQLTTCSGPHWGQGHGHPLGVMWYTATNPTCPDLPDDNSWVYNSNYHMITHHAHMCVTCDNYFKHSYNHYMGRDLSPLDASVTRQGLVLLDLSMFSRVAFSKFSMTDRSDLNQPTIVLLGLKLPSNTLQVILVGENDRWVT